MRAEGCGEYVCHADDAGIVSKSAEGLAKMVTVIVRDCLRSSRPHGIGEKKYKDDVAVKSRPDAPRPTAGHRSSMPEV